MTRRGSLLLGIAGGVGFVVSCVLVAHGLRSSSLYADVNVYARYAEQMANGDIPYRDFFDEYPPLAQPVFLLGRIAGTAHYAVVFKTFMTLCGLGALACAVVILHALRASAVRSIAAVTVIAVSPLLVGPIFLNAYDLWPAMLLALALALLVRHRPLWAFGVLGAAVAAKVYPVAVLPLALLYVEARLRRSAAVTFVAVVVLAHLPALVLGPGGLRHSYWLQAKRGLELNSLGGAVLLAFRHPALRNEPPGSLNVVGSGAGGIAAVSSLLVLGVIAAAAVLFTRSARGPNELVVASAAAVAGFVALDKVFSAQYVDWLVPLAPLAGVAASALTAVVLALTRAVFSHRTGIANDDGGPVVILLVRDSLVLLLAALLLWTVQRSRTVTRS